MRDPIITIIECVYLIYMMCFFKTKYSIHHPFEIFMQTNYNLGNWIRHPIHSSIYQNKICTFGHVSSYLLAIWLIFSYFFHDPVNILINKIIWITTIIISLTLNMNAFIYLIPIFIYELYYLNIN